MYYTYVRLLIHRWYKDGELVQIPGVEKRHELRRVGNVVQLIIRNANASDAGTYTLDIGGQKFDAILTIKGWLQLGSNFGSRGHKPAVPKFWFNSQTSC